MLSRGPVTGSHPEDPLSGLIPKAWIEQQTVQLLHAPLQQHCLHLLARRAAPQELIQHIQGLHHLSERDTGKMWRRRLMKSQEMWSREGKVWSCTKCRYTKTTYKEKEIRSKILHGKGQMIAILNSWNKNSCKTCELLPAAPLLQSERRQGRSEAPLV